MHVLDPDDGGDSVNTYQSGYDDGFDHAMGEKIQRIENPTPEYDLGWADGVKDAKAWDEEAMTREEEIAGEEALFTYDWDYGRE